MKQIDANKNDVIHAMAPAEFISNHNVIDVGITIRKLCTNTKRLVHVMVQVVKQPKKHVTPVLDVVITNNRI